jgi:hypothetical protein
MSFEVSTQLRRKFSFFVFRSGLSATGLARVYCNIKQINPLSEQNSGFLDVESGGMWSITKFCQVTFVTCWARSGDVMCFL